MAPIEGNGAFFEGQWEDARGAVVEIKGDFMFEMKGKTKGKRAEITFETEHTCMIKRGHNEFRGTLSEGGNVLEWPENTVWRRRGALHRERTAQTRQTLSLEQALSMQTELRDGFSSQYFQSKLQILEKTYKSAPDTFIAERAQLFLSVQGPVLTRYGFEASREGVIAMLDAAARFNGNKDYVNNRDALNKLIGLVDMDCGGSVLVRHLFDEGSLEVQVPRHGTFLDVKRALSELAGSDEILKRGILCRRGEDCALNPYRDADLIGNTAEVLLFRADLPGQQHALPPLN